MDFRATSAAAARLLQQSATQHAFSAGAGQSQWGRGAVTKQRRQPVVERGRRLTDAEHGGDGRVGSQVASHNQAVRGKTPPYNG